MKKLFLAAAVPLLMLLSAQPGQAQVQFSLSIGTPPPPPRAYRVQRMPGPGYEWVEGYWYPVNGRWAWHNGYWTRPPMPDAYWVAPYWERGRYYEGYWGTRRGPMDHDHRWDRERGRDGDREWRDHRGHDDRYRR